MANTIDGIHTTTNPKGTGWVNQANGVVLSSHKTKITAVASGRLVARRHGAQFTVHRKDGTVIQTRSYAVSPI
jgi:uncharacterized protein DUF2188